MKRMSRAKGNTAVTVELECLVCKARQSVELSSKKFKALSAAWKLEQSCGVCKKPTEWTFAEAVVAAEEQVDFWDWLAATGEYFEPGGETPQHERRKERRVDLTVPMRISSRGGDEGEVTSENISRSGFCFSSRRTYTIGEIVQVTLQPAGAVAPLSRTATIVRASVAEDKFLYGARLETPLEPGAPPPSL